MVLVSANLPSTNSPVAFPASAAEEPAEEEPVEPVELPDAAEDESLPVSPHAAIDITIAPASKIDIAFFFIFLPPYSVDMDILNQRTASPAARLFRFQFL